MTYPIFIAIGIIVLIVAFIFSDIRAGKKLKLKLIHSFGKPPDKLDYELSSIEAYHFYKKSRSNNAYNIDDITWNDLEMDKVFKRINVCLTSVGEEYLYDCLHEPQFEQSKLLEREAFISSLKEHPEERLKLQICLSKTGKSDYNGIASFIYNASEKSLKHPLLYKLLSFIPILCMVTMCINTSIGLACLLVSFSINLIVHYMMKRNIELELAAIQYFSSLLWCCNKLCKIKIFKPEPLFLQLKEKFDTFKSLAGKTSGILKKGATDMEVFVEYFKILFLYDIRQYNDVIHKIIKHTNDFRDLYKTIGEIDLSICVLSYRESLPFFSIPQFHDENCIVFEEAYHPLISNPITNSWSIRNNSIITGSNASGKSTFIKALAVNGILAQTIYTCTAKNFNVRFSLIITSMAIRDDISAGESYFIKEIKSLKRILDKIQTVICTCFIDEILRGTNTVERIAASASVLKYLNDRDCLCIVASHDIELTSMLKNEYDNYHFCEQITSNELTFDYKLKQGPSQTRNAIKLLQLIDFDSAIVKNAEVLANSFEASKTL